MVNSAGVCLVGVWVFYWSALGVYSGRLLWLSSGRLLALCGLSTLAIYLHGLSTLAVYNFFGMEGVSQSQILPRALLI